jgi:DDE superfamily endonuclease
MWAAVARRGSCRGVATASRKVSAWESGGSRLRNHADPYTPAKHFDKGKSDPGFRTKLQIGAGLARRAEAAGFPFRAVAADSAYGDQDGFRGELREAGLPFVMALKPHHGTWAYGLDAHTPVDAARTLIWQGPGEPGDWQPVERTFHDGHTETWYAADATLGAWGPDGHTRLVVATKDPATLPQKATWYLATNLPRPGSPRVHESEHPPADLAEITGIHGIRHWIEQAYKQVKDQLGWADFQVRSDTAIRRHQTLVNCAFSFCWDAGPDRQPPEDTQQPTDSQPPQPEDTERRDPKTRTSAHRLLAQSTPPRPRLAHPVSDTPTLVAGLVQHTPTPAATSPDRRRHCRTGPAPLPPNLTNYRYPPGSGQRGRTVGATEVAPRPVVPGHGTSRTQVTDQPTLNLVKIVTHVQELRRHREYHIRIRAEPAALRQRTNPLRDTEGPSKVNPDSPREQQLVGIRPIYVPEKEALGMLAIKTEPAEADS